MTFSYLRHDIHSPSVPWKDEPMNAPEAGAANARGAATRSHTPWTAAGVSAGAPLQAS